MVPVMVPGGGCSSDQAAVQLCAERVRSCDVYVGVLGTRAAGAVDAFARVDAVTSAAGVAADTGRLLDVIVSHDRAGVLAGVRAGQGQ